MQRLEEHLNLENQFIGVQSKNQTTPKAHLTWIEEDRNSEISLKSGKESRTCLFWNGPPRYEWMGARKKILILKRKIIIPMVSCGSSPSLLQRYFLVIFLGFDRRDIWDSFGWAHLRTILVNGTSETLLLAVYPPVSPSCEDSVNTIFIRDSWNEGWTESYWLLWDWATPNVLERFQLHDLVLSLYIYFLTKPKIFPHKYWPTLRTGVDKKMNTLSFDGCILTTRIHPQRQYTVPSSKLKIAMEHLQFQYEIPLQMVNFYCHISYRRV